MNRILCPPCRILIHILFILGFLSAFNPGNIFSQTSAQRAAPYFDKGMSKYLAGDTRGAIQDLEKVIEIDSKHEQARTLLSILLGETASSYFIQGDYAHALPLLEKLRKILPQDQSIRRMYEQSKKGLGTIQRSEEMVDFLQKQQKNIISQKPSPPSTKIDKKAPAGKSETAASPVATVPAPSQSAINEEMNRRILILKSEMEKREQGIIAKTTSQFAEEKRELIKKFFLWGGILALSSSLLLAFLALVMHRKSQQKNEETAIRDLETAEPVIPEEMEPKIIAAVEPPPEPPPILQDKPLDPLEAIETSEPVAPSVQEDAAHPELIYRNACRGVHHIFEMVQDWDLTISHEALEIAGEIIETLRKNNTLLIRKALLPYEDISNYIFAHSVNVAIISCYLKLNNSQTALEEIVLAGILHDIGTAEKLSMVQESRRLDEAELEIMRVYRKSGAWILTNCDEAKKGPESLFIKVSKIIHEMYQSDPFADLYDLNHATPLLHPSLTHAAAGPTGAGQDKPDTLRETAVLLASVEMFEALTHERPYRYAFTPSQAIAMMNESAEKNVALKSALDLLMQKLDIRDQTADAVRIKKT